jgi:hypothetical protein
LRTKVTRSSMRISPWSRANKAEIKFGMSKYQRARDISCLLHLHCPACFSTDTPIRAYCKKKKYIHICIYIKFIYLLLSSSEKRTYGDWRTGKLVVHNLLALCIVSFLNAMKARDTIILLIYNSRAHSRRYKL